MRQAEERVRARARADATFAKQVVRELIAAYAGTFPVDLRKEVRKSDSYTQPGSGEVSFHPRDYSARQLERDGTITEVDVSQSFWREARRKPSKVKRRRAEMRPEDIDLIFNLLYRRR